MKPITLTKKLYIFGLSLLLTVSLATGQTSPHPDQVYPIPNNYGNVNTGGVNIFTGDVNFTTTLASISGRHLNYTLHAFYNSRSAWLNTKNGSSVSNALGGWGWKLMDYPKIVQDGNSYYMLDGQAAYPLEQSGTTVNYVTGNTYYLWLFSYNSQTNTWMLTDESGVVHTLGNTARANGYSCWNLSQINDPNWPDTLTFTYQEMAITGISNTMNDEMELLYDNTGLLTTINIYQNKADNTQEQQFLEQVNLAYNKTTGQYNGNPLLLQLQMTNPLKNDHFTAASPPLQLTYFDTGANYPLAMQRINNPSGAIQSYQYTKADHEGLSNIAIRYALNDGYLLAKDDEEEDNTRVFSALWYTAVNSTTDATGIYRQYNKVRVYPGGFYTDVERKIDPTGIHDPYGHTVYYFFNGAVKDSLRELPGDYPDIDVQSPVVRGLTYQSKSFNDYDEAAAINLIDSTATYWDIYQRNNTSIAKVQQTTSALDSVDYSTHYRYNTDYYLPVAVMSERRNPKLGGGTAMQKDSVKTTVRYAYQDYPELETLNILFPKSQTTGWVKESGKNDWEITGSSTTHWSNDWSGQNPGWAPQQNYVLQLPIGPSNLSSGLSENPPAAWLKTGTVSGRNTYGVVTLSANTEAIPTSILYDDLFQTYPVASFINADSYAGQAGYYGFETYETESDWTVSGGSITRSNAHTGARSYASNSSATLTVKAAAYQPRTGGSTSQYVISAFVKLASGGSCSYGFYNGSQWQDGGGTLSYNAAQTGWQYIQFISTGAASATYIPTVQCTNCMVDDIRFGPLDAPFSANIYYDNRAKQDNINITVGETGEYEANYVITVADNYQLASGESMTLLAGEKISFGTGVSIAPGARLTTQLLEGLHMNMNKITATLGSNGETERTVYNTFNAPVAVVGPAGQARSLNLAYGSRRGNYLYNGNDTFDPDYPNMQMNLSAREGGGWEGFQFTDNPNFPPANLENMYVLDEALFTGAGADTSDEASAILAVAIDAPSYALYAEAEPEGLTSDREMALAMGSGSDEIRLALTGNGYRLYQPSGSLDKTVNLAHIPAAAGLTLVVLDELHLFAYADGRFLFDYTLSDPVNNSIRLVSSDPGGSFENFIFLEDPLISLSMYDANGEARQFQMKHDPAQIYIREHLYGGDLGMPVATTRSATTSNSNGVLSYQPDYATLDISNEQLQVTQDSEIYDIYDDQQPFSSSVVRYNDPSLRNYSSSGGGSLTAGNSDASNYDYSDNGTNDFNFENQELQQTTANTSLTSDNQVQSQTYTGAETGAVFGQVHTDPASGESLQQQAVYDKNMQLSQGYYPNFFDPAIAGSGQFVIQTGYNFLGDLMVQSTPDHGTTQYGYDKAGRSRLMLDANGYTASTPYYLYIKYDDLGRITEKGLLPDADINRTVTDLGNGSVERAVGQLTVENATISSGETVTLHAGRKISFGTGFKAAPGATIHAKILNTALQDYNKENLENNSWPQSGQQVVNTYAYDQGVNAIGRLVTATHYDTQGQAANTESYTYDLEGNTTSITLSVQNESGDPDSSSLQYSYNLLGAIIQIEQDNQNSSNSFSYRVTYEYDRLGRITAIGDGSSINAYASYGYGNGTFTETLNPGGMSVTRTYTSTPEGWTSRISDALFREDLYYQQRANGSPGYVNGLISGANYQFNFSNPPENYNYDYMYDGFGRLTQADASTASAALDTITYDPDGNILSLEENSTTTYTYVSGTNQLHSTSGGISASFAYDADGNMQQAGTLQLSYFPFSNLAQQITKGNTIVDFSYNTQAQRIRKVVNSDTLTYYHGLNDYPLLEITSANTGDPTAQAYIYGPTGLVAIQQQASGNPENYFVLKDHLGSTRVVTDSDLNVAAYFNYDPFGELIGSYDPGTVTIRYRYTGQEYDSETGLYNYRARLYDAALGRFYAPDPLQQQTSAYAYVGNNPVSLTDANGAWWGIDDLVAVGVGALVGGAGELISEAISGEGINWKKVGVSAAAGAIAGEVELYAGPVAAGAVYGGLNQLGDNLVDGKTGWGILDGVATQAVIGAATAGVMEAAGSLASKGLEKAANTSAGRAVREFTSDLTEKAANTSAGKAAREFAAAAEEKGGALGRKVKGFFKKGCGCFTEGTLVKTAEGYKDIAAIEVGDFVWAFNTATGEKSLKKVLRVFSLTRKATYTVYVDDKVIETTSEHPFYVNAQWVRADRLRAGDSLQLFSGKKAVVDSVVVIPHPARVYNFEVEKVHTYYVSEDGVLVHNPDCVFKGAGDPGLESHHFGEGQGFSVVLEYPSGDYRAVPTHNTNLTNPEWTAINATYNEQDYSVFGARNRNGTHQFLSQAMGPQPTGATRYGISFIYESVTMADEGEEASHIFRVGFTSGINNPRTITDRRVISGILSFLNSKNPNYKYIEQ